jgi:hypothetical protein
MTTPSMNTRRRPERSAARPASSSSKPKIRVEAGRGPVNVFFPQTHRPGEEAEVDFGEVTIILRGEPVTCILFALQLSMFLMVSFTISAVQADAASA